MTAAAPSHGVVSIAALDLRHAPDHRAELGSQLLLGEVVRRLGQDRTGAWWRVENLSDGYRGWVRTWGVVPASAARARRWERRAVTRVVAPIAHAHAGTGGRGTLVSPLFLNARVIAGPARAGHRRVELPDGRRGQVPARALAHGRTRPPALLDRVRTLLGVPYLWGGRTPAAFDCSGFTQQVLAEQGVRLPRDAHHQYRATHALARGDSDQPGDLVFFGRPGERIGHVGLGLGGGWFAHCRGVVRINSIDPSNPMCDSDLCDQFRGWKRPG